MHECGHAVDHADNGRDGLFMASSEAYDAIILDRMLPGGIDGLAIIEALRKTGNKTPILILSALAEVDDRIRGLRAGGDDYLTKPFAFGELAARLDALVRRSQGADAQTTLVAAIFVLSSLVLVGFLWWRTAAYLDREVDAVIRADVRAVGDRLHDFGLPGAIETINERIGKAGDKHAIYLLTDPTLTPVVGNLDAWPLDVGREQGWHQIELSPQGDMHATRILYVVLSSGFHLLVGRDVEDRVAIQQAILDGLGWAAATAMLLAIGGGLLVRRAIVRRVEVINLAATAIIHGDLSSRLPTRGLSDEFDRLAQTINGMLQQIEVLIDGVRSASNAVAHDLRTPLAELRGRLVASCDGLDFDR